VQRVRSTISSRRSARLARRDEGANQIFVTPLSEKLNAALGGMQRWPDVRELQQL